MRSGISENSSPRLVLFDGAVVGVVGFVGGEGAEEGTDVAPRGEFRCFLLGLFRKDDGG
jgi:hypothetical protein